MNPYICQCNSPRISQKDYICTDRLEIIIAAHEALLNNWNMNENLYGAYTIIERNLKDINLQPGKTGYRRLYACACRKGVSFIYDNIEKLFYQQ